jgi:dextranase
MLLPTKARYAPGESAVLEVDPEAVQRSLTVTHLGRTVASLTVPAGATEISLPGLPEGGYGVALSTGDSTAVELLPARAPRMRYGFVADFGPEKDIESVVRHFRRLHLTAAQFYDWAYRHADLVGPDSRWHDPLGQVVSLATVRALGEAFNRAGTLPLGYAAVYGVGKQEWPAWEDVALLRRDGTPHELGGFLSIVDPSDPGWLAHFTADLRRATDAAGFAGFHLDQYGFPRRAVRPDGRVVDLADAFDTVIRAVRHALPEAYLVFNNVNDFPVWATSRSPQDATYTEVWTPHDTLADIAAVATRARLLAPDRPVVLAAYQSVYATSPAHVADATTRLTMATAFSHGATQLLCGEAGSVLVDPYYVRNHAAVKSTVDMLARWYDLLVAAGDLLFDPEAVDITRSVAGSLNDEIDVTAPHPVDHRGDPGTIWRRAVQTPQGTVVHLINLTGQAETGWDTPKSAIGPVEGIRLRVRRTGHARPEVLVADPDRGPHFVSVPVTADGEHAHADLPPLHAWQIVLIRTEQENR